MIVKSIEKNDLDNICLIHKRSFDSSHFTSVLPFNVLKKYYDKIISNCEYKVMIYENDSNYPVGFAIGSKNVSGILNSFIREQFFTLIFILLKNPIFLFEKISSIIFSFTSKEPTASKAEAVLLSISVNPELEMRGKGLIVLSEFENVLKEAGIKTYNLGVRRSNKKAISFYKRNGFLLDYSVRESDYYIKTLS